jgi:cell volume regulation protein A
VVDTLRVRRDRPGALIVLADGRYAVTSPALAVGGRDDVIEWIRRRLTTAGEDDRAWLQTVMGAIAADMHDRRA